MTLRTVCAWCKAVLTEGDEPTSHGICDACADSLAEATNHPAGSARDHARPVSSFWTNDRYGLFLLTCSLIIAVLLGRWWGA